MASGDSKTSGFKVTDRRSFAEAGSDQGTPGTGPETSPAAPATDDEAAPAPTSASSSAQAAAYPPVDFHTFVLSLGSSALLHLGELEHPDAGAPQKDLQLAKHTIDLLVMLEQKTKGNLSPAEEKLIESLLYDLRLRYVEASKP